MRILHLSYLNYCTTVSKICHMFFSVTSLYALYLCICVLAFLYLPVWHMGISFVISLNNPLFKNMPYVGCFWHFVICCICVVCIYILYCLTLVNIIFDILEQSSFQKYGTCWVFLALRHMLYLCICVFVFVYLCMRHLVISVLISLDQ